MELPGLDEDWVDVSARPLMCGFHRCDPMWDLPPRRRAHYQLWVITSGEMDFRIGTGPVVQVGAGSLIMLAPRVTQRATFRRGPLETYVTHFMVFDHGAPHLAMWASAVVEDVPEPTWSRIVADVQQLADTLPERAPVPGRAEQLLSTAAMTDLLGRVDGLLAIGPRTRRTEQQVPDAVTAAIDYIRTHPDEQLSTSGLAAQVRCRPETLRIGIRRATGQSPSEFIRQHRLSLARALLRDTSLPIAAIARRTGYPDPFYFSRVFRDAEGIPPSQWRESLGDTLNSGPRTPVT